MKRGTAIKLVWFAFILIDVAIRVRSAVEEAIKLAVLPPAQWQNGIDTFRLYVQTEALATAIRWLLYGLLAFGWVHFVVLWLWLLGISWDVVLRTLRGHPMFDPLLRLLAFLSGDRAIRPPAPLNVLPLPREVNVAIRGDMTAAEFNLARRHLRSHYFNVAKNRFGTPADTILMRETVRRWVANQLLADGFSNGVAHLITPVVTEMVFAMSAVERRARDEVGLALDAGRIEDARSVVNLSTWRKALAPRPV
jgi:hypothetical protein